MGHEVVIADVIEWAKTYQGPKFHALLCDPPYHLTSIVKRFGGKNAAPAQQGTDGRFSRLSKGFMGQEWDGGDIAFRPETWAALGEHLLPGAHLLAFGGTRTWHRLACAIEDAGFELRDTLLWLYGQGFPKSHDVSKGIDHRDGAKREVVGERTGPGYAKANVEQGAQGRTHTSFPEYSKEAATEAGRQWDGWGTALKPAWEPVILARWPLEGTVAANCVEHGTGALNIDGCRIDGMVPQTTQGASSRIYGGGSGFAPNGMQKSNPSSLGRWPANLIHDGSDEVLAGFPASSVTGNRTADSKGRWGAASPLPGSGETNAKGTEYTDSGSAARFFYCAKASKAERNKGTEGNDHPTLKPLDLIRYLSLLILPPPLDVPRRILVPFAGSGSEMIGARQAGWDEVLGIEISQHYADIAAARLAAWLGML
jgi:DNA modification methylase